MSGLFRSEDMTFVRILMSEDAAYDTVRELGKFSKLHINDLGEASAQAASAGHAGAPAAAASSESNYTIYKKRVAVCQFWERKFLSFKEAFQQYKIAVPDALNPHEVSVEDIRSADVIEDCRSFVEPLEAAFTKNVMFRRSHKQQINEYIEYLYVLKYNADNRFANQYSASAEHNNPVGGSGFGQFHDVEEKMEGGGFRGKAPSSFTSTICGVIPVDKVIPFERLLFRVSRGNALSTFFEVPQLIEDPQTGEKVKKNVFAVTFMGEQLSKRISRIIQHSGATEYPLPGTPNEILQMERDIQHKLQDGQTVLQRTDAEIRDQLQSLAIDPATRNVMPYQSPYLNWLTALQKERHICNTLKKCEQSSSNSKVMTLEGWCPDSDLDDLQQALATAVRATQAKQAVLQTYRPVGMNPPTYFKTNAFTGSFQGIVDTYGVPRYKEVNPGLFTIISFPFLFGIMYGDIGHGTILFLFAAYLLWNEGKFNEQLRRGTMGEIPSMVFGGRYLLILMGAFALYAGTIYNDCFSNPTHVFPSHWVTSGNGSTSVDDFDGSPYPYGVDPAWYHTTNELAFFNSMKMKLAVTLGVTQMTFGICLGAFNDVYFKDYLAIFFEFIPRMIFILATFGYMVFIIIFKMCVEWGPGSTPPLLIQTMIQMFLSPGSVTKENELYAGQGAVQAALVLMAVFSVPFMLFPIPCITNSRNKDYMRQLAGHGHNDAIPRRSSIALSDMAGAADDKEAEPASPRSDTGFGAPSSGRALKENLLDGQDSEGAPEVRRPSQAVIIDDRHSDESKENSIASPPPVVVDEVVPDAGHGEHALGPHYSYSDHLIVQGIHTIEFVLGTVSNTASYLRLWALSLAHAELSGVFWDKMIMQYGILGSNAFSPVVGFAVWGVATFAVLLAMDVLECFLHALRLHWVEFQNKFFRADGYAFDPFTFNNLGAEDKAA